MTTETIPGKEEIIELLGQAYTAYALVDGFIDCFYKTEIIWGQKDKISLFSARYRQGGKTLCSIHFNKDYFILCIIFGRWEREKFETAAFQVNERFQKAYEDAVTYPDGKWMAFAVNNACDFDDIKRLLSIKRKPDDQAMSMCGIKCSQCKAYAKNIQKEDRRQGLSQIWKTYFDVELPKEQIFCDGCRCSKKDARMVERDCPVKNCVLDKKLNHCGECPDFPCDTFGTRAGMNFCQAKEKSGGGLSVSEYQEFLSAYDNRTRLENYQKCK